VPEPPRRLVCYQPSLQKPNMSNLLTNACVSELASVVVKKKDEDVAICSPSGVLWLLHSGCAIPTSLSGNIAVATVSLTHLHPCAPSCTRFVACLSNTQVHAKRRKTTDRHTQPTGLLTPNCISARRSGLTTQPTQSWQM
jgi:hypothetical protein